MKKLIVAVALATLIGSSAFAAAPNHRAPVAHDGMAAYGQAAPDWPRPSNLDRRTYGRDDGSIYRRPNRSPSWE